MELHIYGKRSHPHKRKEKAKEGQKEVAKVPRVTLGTFATSCTFLEEVHTSYMQDDKHLKEENPGLFHIAREQGTEPPFIGQYVHTHDAGVYVCAVCGALLFSSDTKFESGSGWPSFTRPISKDAVILSEDSSHNMFRTEVRCAKCNAHLGHVFPDGPKKYDGACDRYCVNSISLHLHKED